MVIKRHTLYKNGYVDGTRVKWMKKCWRRGAEVDNA